MGWGGGGGVWEWRIRIPVGSDEGEKRDGRIEKSQRISKGKGGWRVWMREKRLPSQREVSKLGV